ncbi:hypothetical protein OTU49_004291 [Cherax quadricarinatus]|uniref:C2H2-type domain-containing protein n=1 Tax=Cherax quadricarinatus TaxID=27406 RepID=A0AAW0X1W2_CHEQU
MNLFFFALNGALVDASPINDSPIYILFLIFEALNLATQPLLALKSITTNLGGQPLSYTFQFFIHMPVLSAYPEETASVQHYPHFWCSTAFRWLHCLTTKTYSQKAKQLNMLAFGFFVMENVFTIGFCAAPILSCHICSSPFQLSDDSSYNYCHVVHTTTLLSVV